MTAVKYEVYMKNLPIIPQVASKIMSITEDSLVISFRELEEIIMVDPLLSSRILKVANSALYARQRQVTSLQSAITLLGFKTIKSLVMLVSASNMFRKYSRTPFYQIFWHHSLLTAFIAKDAASHVGMKPRRDELFLAGLFHDIGKVALFHCEPEAYSRLLEEQKETGADTRELERQYFGTDHREIGGAVMEEWNFPESFTDTAKEHGSLNITSPRKQVILLVTAADILAEKISNEALSGKKQTILDSIPDYIPLDESRIAFYENEFSAELEMSHLYSECSAIFNVN